MRIKIWTVSIVVILVSLILGAYANQPAVAAEPIILGLPSSMVIIEPLQCKDSVEMAVEEVNAAGGVNVAGVKRPFKVVSIDTRDGEPGMAVSEALMAYEKLILEHKPHAIVVSFYSSEATLAGMDITTKYKIPNLHTISMSPKFQEKILEKYNDYKYNFRLCYNSIYFVGGYVKGLELIGKQFGFKKSYILTEEALWAKAIGGASEKWYKENGWQVTMHETFPKGISDFSVPLSKVKSTGAQVITFVCSRPEAAIMADQWRAMKIPAMLTGILPPLGGEDIWGLYKGKVEGVINTLEAGIVPIKAIPKSIEFHEKFKKRTGKPLGGSHGQGPAYDAVYVLKDAIERAGTLDADKLVTAIEATDREGVIGKIRFGKDHQVPFGTNPKEAAMLVNVQWQKPGKRVVIYPESIAEGKIQLPPWWKK
jgi:branched-chain amino acid transport system substrate-binding protein